MADLWWCGQRLGNINLLCGSQAMFWNCVAMAMVAGSVCVCTNLHYTHNNCEKNTLRKHAWHSVHIRKRLVSYAGCMHNFLIFSYRCPFIYPFSLYPYIFLFLFSFAFYLRLVAPTPRLVRGGVGGGGGGGDRWEGAAQGNESDCLCAMVVSIDFAFFVCPFLVRCSFGKI